VRQNEERMKNYGAHAVRRNINGVVNETTSTTNRQSPISAGPKRLSAVQRRKNANSLSRSNTALMSSNSSHARSCTKLSHVPLSVFFSQDQKTCSTLCCSFQHLHRVQQCNEAPPIYHGVLLVSAFFFPSLGFLNLLLLNHIYPNVTSAKIFNDGPADVSWF
jgi:hypothetical protein